MTIAELEHECRIAGHELNCRECGRESARARVRWAASRLSPKEGAALLRLAEKVEVIDELVKTWGLPSGE